MSFNPYTYEELIDVKYSRFIKSELNLNFRISSEAIFIRALSGTLRCTHSITSNKFDQLENYFILGRTTNTQIKASTIKKLIEPDININNLCNFLNETRRTNHAFFENLVIEITSFFYKKLKQNHTTAFLHLYRALEYISYSFPLIYASHSRDYHGTFERLKNYFDNSKSELLFFEAFVNKIFDGLGYLEAPVTFNFNSLIPQINSNHYKIIKESIDHKKILSDSANTSITFSYDQLIKLFIKIRNRYFHFAVGGQRNIKGTDIVESDIFFSIINDEVLNWIGLVYYEILKTFCS